MRMRGTGILPPGLMNAQQLGLSDNDTARTLLRTEESFMHAYRYYFQVSPEVHGCWSVGALELTAES